MGWMKDLFDKSQEIPMSGVLRERLGYLQQRYDDLEAERDKLLGQVRELKAKANIPVFASRPEPAQTQNKLSDEEVQILQLIAEADEAGVEDIARTLQLNKARAEFLLIRLEDTSYLRDSWGMGYHSFLMDQRGREYLINNDLI